MVEQIKSYALASNKKAKVILKWLLTLIAVSVLCIIGFLYWISHELFFDPVCGNWHSGMSKDEKIMLALEAANKEPKPIFKITNSDTGNTHLGRGKQIPYPDAASILRENPNCCKLVLKKVEGSKNLDETVADDEGVVILHYKGRYKQNTGVIKEAPIVLQQDLNLCKKVGVYGF